MRDSVRVDVDAELEGFRRAAARRRLTNASLLGAKVVLSLLAATGLARWLGASGEQTNVPVGPPTGVPSSPAAGFGTGAGCEQLRVACRDGGTSTIYLDAPLVWTLPHGFDSPYSGELSSSSVKTRASGGGAGVTVLEHVSAATSEAPA